MPKHFILEDICASFGLTLLFKIYELKFLGFRKFLGDG